MQGDTHTLIQEVLVRHMGRTQREKVTPEQRRALDAEYRRQMPVVHREPGGRRAAARSGPVTVTYTEPAPRPRETPHRHAYREYMASGSWSARKARYYSAHPRRCAVCGCAEVDLHHATYERMGRERDEDLVPLCADHHQMVHRLHALQPELDLRAATDAILNL